MSSTRDGPGRRRRLLFYFAAVLLIIIGIAAWILKTNEIMSNLGAVFTILGVLLPFLYENPPSTPSASVLSADSITTKQSYENNYTKIEGITDVTLGLTRSMGALIIITSSSQFGSSINLNFGFNKSSEKADIVEHIVRRKMNTRTVFVGIFRELPAGNYRVYSDTLGLEEKVTIYAGDVKEIDLREKTRRHTKKQDEA